MTPILMKALILAAGLGNRLGDLTTDRPKAMVPVLNRELILRVFDFLDHPAITKKAVVTGYMADDLKNFVKRHAPDTEIFYNPNYKQGSIRTLETAIPFLDDDFLLMNVDHIYPKRMLPIILHNSKGISAICDFDRKLGGDDMKVKLDRGNNMTRIMKTLDDFDGGYIGMTFCKAAHLAKYKEAIKQTRKIYGDESPVEWVLGHMAANGEKINICDASGVGWLEVDTPDDLKFAEGKLKENEGFLK